MSQTTNISNLVINKMTKAQYDALETKDPTQLYYVVDDVGVEAGSGLAFSNNTLNHSNSVTAGTAGTSSATSGATLAVPYVTYDAQGHITTSGTHTHTIGSLATSAITSGTFADERIASASTWNGKQDALTFDGTYDASINPAATLASVSSAIAALDGGTIGTPGTGKTITALSETDGQISATFGDISITTSQVSDFPTIPTATSDLNNDSGFITSSDIPVTSVNTKTGAVSLSSSDVGAIADPETKSSGQFLKYNGTSWVADNPPSAPVTSVNTKTGAVVLTASDVGALPDNTSYVSSFNGSSGAITYTAPVTSVNTKTGAVTLTASDVGALPSDTTIPQGTVTSVQVQATSPVQSSTSTSQSTSLNTTISLANGYGDTKNPYGTKNKNKVLAGPSTGADAAPTFRALVADDIPSLTVSKISDFPSTMTPSSHTHGDITNSGDITTTATIASGDRLVINDESASKVTNSSITFGTSTTTFLANNGTWQSAPENVLVVDYNDSTVTYTQIAAAASNGISVFVNSGNGYFLLSELTDDKVAWFTGITTTFAVTTQAVSYIVDDVGNWNSWSVPLDATYVYYGDAETAYLRLQHDVGYFRSVIMQRDITVNSVSHAIIEYFPLTYVDRRLNTTYPDYHFSGYSEYYNEFYDYVCSYDTSTEECTWSYTHFPIFPSQSGNSGKFLTTNGTDVSWATVDALPSQSGNSGKFLTTNGSAASWTTITQDDHKWDNVALSKTPVVSSDTFYVPRLANTSATTAYMQPASDTPGDRYIAVYDTDSYLKSTTPSANDNSTKVATTAYVDAAIPGGSSTSPKMDGTATVGTETTWAHGDHIHPTDTTRAPLDSPALTGTPTAPTASTSVDNTQIATTAFVHDVVDALGSILNYKGTKATASQLPSTGNTTGDVWIVTEDNSEYVWNGTAWEKLGPTIDLSGYVPTSRTINNKALSSDITLTASDVGALPSDTTIPPGTVTSVRVQATSPVQSSVNTEQTSSLNTTISLADGYGDTKNPYAVKNANKVLAGPSSGNDAAPSFRALVADDIPSLTVSKISDFPSTMPPSSHTHGNITNGGDITTTVTIASGDRLVINDESEGELNNSSITFGSSTTTFLANNGTWQTPANTDTKVTQSSTNDAKDYPILIKHSADDKDETDTVNYAATGKEGGVTINPSTSVITAAQLTITGSVSNDSDAATKAYADSKQTKITASGILKGNGSGTVTAAVAGTDYQAPLPSQSGNSGKYLTTNGSALSWGEVDALPSQTGNAGKFLTTNGTTTSWGTPGAGIKTVSNSAITASSGVFTWTISAANAFSSADIIITVYEVSTGAVVYPNVVVNQSTGEVTITINDTASAGTLAAGTYKAVMIG